MRQIYGFVDITCIVQLSQAKDSSTPQLGASAVREYHWGLPLTVADI